jgi:hypothetical protein
MIEQLFEVATEFHFEVGQAMVNAQGLQKAVDGISNSANGALNSLNFLASGLSARLGFGSGGLLNILSQAVQLSQAFDQSALNMSNTIVTNMKVLTGTIDTFNDRLDTSKMILDNISGVAIKFGIPSSELGRLSQLIATPLAAKGKLGHNFGGAIEMSKNLLLSAESIGVHPQAAGESLYRALSDKAPLHGQLFTRLANTMPFREAHVRSQMQLIQMNPEKKIDLLNKALASLASDSDALAFRMTLLRTRMLVLKEEIIQILRPIGDAIKGPLSNILKGVGEYLHAHGKEFGKSIGVFFQQILKNPREAFLELMQLKSFGSDFRKALHLVEMVAFFRTIRWALGFIGVEFRGGIIITLFRELVMGLRWLLTILPIAKIISGVFSVLSSVISQFLPMFLAFLVIFQILSRARAIARVNEAKAMVEIGPKLIQLGVRFKTALSNIFFPITNMINVMAEWLSIIFDWSFWIRILLPAMEYFVVSLEAVGHAVIYLTAGLSGLFAAIFTFLSNMVHFKLNPFEGVASSFKEEFDYFLKKNKDRLGGEDMKLTANYVNNIGKIEARFDMREQLEPDRIAFKVTEHLKRLATNPTQARGNTLGRIQAGGFTVAGNK